MKDPDNDTLGLSRDVCRARKKTNKKKKRGTDLFPCLFFLLASV